MLLTAGFDFLPPILPGFNQTRPGVGGGGYETFLHASQDKSPVLGWAQKTLDIRI